MSLSFKKATRKGVNIRALFLGKTGSGKTRTALQVACHMAEKTGQRVGVIDTEVLGDDETAVSRAELYADDPCECADCRGHGISLSYDVLKVPPREQTLSTLTSVLDLAAREGVGILVYDTLSAVWLSLLNEADQIKAQSRKADPWQTLTPKWDTFLRRQIGAYPGHVLLTVRTKEKVVDRTQKEWTTQESPVLRDGSEYEFDVGVHVNPSHGAVIYKARGSKLADNRYDRPGRQLAEHLLEWANGGGVDEPEPAPDPVVAELEQQVLDAARAGNVLGDATDALKRAGGDVTKLNQLLVWAKQKQLEAQAVAQQEQGEWPEVEDAPVAGGAK